MNSAVKMKLYFTGIDGKEFILTYKILDTPVAKRWLSILQMKLKEDQPLEPALFKGFYRSAKDLEDRWHELEQIVVGIQNYNRYFLDFDFESLPKNQSSLNQLHLGFEKMRGEHLLAQPFYYEAPLAIQGLIDALNEKIHETEGVVGGSNPISGRIKINLKNKDRFLFEDDEESAFQTYLDFGDVCLRYCETGKPPIDVFEDKDDLVSPDNINSHRHLDGQIDLVFSEGEFRKNENYKRSLADWVESKKDLFKNKKLNLGWIVVAKLEKLQEPKEICALAGQATALTKIEILN
jgi:hypothetical protein